jgi:hypothetical protein
MKIRIKGNTVRYRLSKSEVKQLMEKGYVEEETIFPTNTFSYKLLAKKEIECLEAEFLYHTITMFIPDIEAKSWYDSDQITYKNTYENLTLILEKDFVCLDHSDEDQTDNYQNPNKTC